jgi:predicted component of type VI protein secretion system
VSKLHCAIARWAGKLVLRDLKSANGTFLNGQRVSGEAWVADGDTLQVGSFAFTFCVQQSAADLPVQIVLPGEVGWLLQTPEDPSLLGNALAGTAEVHALPEGVGTSPAPGQRVDPEDLSAGQYLRDYLQQQRR